MHCVIKIVFLQQVRQNHAFGKTVPATDSDEELLSSESLRLKNESRCGTFGELLNFTWLRLTITVLLAERTEPFAQVQPPQQSHVPSVALPFPFAFWSKHVGFLRQFGGMPPFRSVLTYVCQRVCCVIFQAPAGASLLPLSAGKRIRLGKNQVDQVRQCCDLNSLSRSFR